MADTAASVLSTAKNKSKKMEEAISCAYSSFARKNSCVAWRNQNIPKTLS